MNFVDCGLNLTNTFLTKHSNNNPAKGIKIFMGDMLGNEIQLFLSATESGVAQLFYYLNGKELVSPKEMTDLKVMFSIFLY